MRRSEKKAITGEKFEHKRTRKDNFNLGGRETTFFLQVHESLAKPR